MLSKLADQVGCSPVWRAVKKEEEPGDDPPSKRMAVAQPASSSKAGDAACELRAEQQKTAPDPPSFSDDSPVAEEVGFT